MPAAPEPPAHEPLDNAWLDAHLIPAPGSSKRDRGDVVIVGGARRTPGAVALAGLAARGASASEAAGWATLLHARAGDLLSERVGPLGALARELADALPALVAERG